MSKVLTHLCDLTHLRDVKIAQMSNVLAEEQSESEEDRLNIEKVT